MKVFSVVALAITLFAGKAVAQHAAGSPYVNLGIKGGLNIYNIHNSNSSSYDTKPGFNLGLIGHIHLAKQVALQPEAFFSLQGAKYTTLGIETKVNLSYINVPVLLQYMFDNGFRLQAGPQVGFLIHAESKTSNTNVSIMNNLKKVDFALSAGLGYVHTPSGFGIDARYNFGLSNINKSSSNKSTNQGFQLGVFFLFNHK
jgi:Outer membrane protein beta-barrel domain